MLRKNRSTEITPRSGGTRAGSLHPAATWFEGMDRWFNDARRDFERAWGAPLLVTSQTPVRLPAVDIRDTGAEFVVTAEMPGVAKEDVEITTTRDGLEIRAQVQGGREQRDAGYYYRERNYSAFHRTVALPNEVVPDKAVANLRDGVLEVRLPKQEPTPETKPVKVKVQ